MFSGLGNSVGILTGDIPYAGGLIHTTDGLFTVPISLSSTSQYIGQTTFTSLTNATNQTSILDSMPLVTVFIPSNEAFAAVNVSPTSPNIASVLSGHVLQNFAGYLPALSNGTSYITQAGTTVTVAI
ncbi:uncharacterized protein PV07_01529 [Cladophialophora immunda]|uniref:FAS1 domain-containing protein n=1 Tax=Cladophialophora immunda TaxID=569365 RepID=A0A0D2CUE7_9EURO|nr:uncharacterized protein PV07_01529 [Cladophialophora immunda]KIW34773.1 hypothetical protein PV07_01529 [Cladophialophora immunda]